MSFDKIERYYHLTPRGWEAEKEEGNPPSDRVLSIMWRRVEQSWDDVEGEETTLETFRSADEAQVKALYKQFGPPPHHG